MTAQMALNYARINKKTGEITYIAPAGSSDIPTAIYALNDFLFLIIARDRIFTYSIIDGWSSSLYIFAYDGDNSKSKISVSKEGDIYAFHRGVLVVSSDKGENWTEVGNITFTVPSGIRIAELRVITPIDRDRLFFGGYFEEPVLHCGIYNFTTDTWEATFPEVSSLATLGVSAAVVSPQGELYIGGEIYPSLYTSPPIRKCKLYSWEEEKIEYLPLTLDGEGWVVKDIDITDNGEEWYFLQTQNNTRRYVSRYKNNYFLKDAVFFDGRWWVGDTQLFLDKNSLAISSLGSVDTIGTGEPTLIMPGYTNVEVPNSSPSVPFLLQISGEGRIGYIRKFIPEKEQQQEILFAEYTLALGETIIINTEDQTVTSTTNPNILNSLVPGSVDLSMKLTPGDNHFNILSDPTVEVSITFA